MSNKVFPYYESPSVEVIEALVSQCFASSWGEANAPGAALTEDNYGSF